MPIVPAALGFKSPPETKKQATNVTCLLVAEKEGFLASEPVGTSVHSSQTSCLNSLCSCHSLALPLSATGSGRARPPRACGARLQIPSKNQKTSHKCDLSFGGGEGPTIPKSKFYFTIPVTIEMVLYRSMQIEDLLFENKIFW